MLIACNLFSNRKLPSLRVISVHTLSSKYLPLFQLGCTSRQEFQDSYWLGPYNLQRLTGVPWHCTKNNNNNQTKKHQNEGYWLEKIMCRMKRKKKKKAQEMEHCNFIIIVNIFLWNDTTYRERRIIRSFSKASLAWCSEISLVRGCVLDDVCKLASLMAR